MLTLREQVFSPNLEEKNSNFVLTHWVDGIDGVHVHHRSGFSDIRFAFVATELVSHPTPHGLADQRSPRDWLAGLGRWAISKDQRTQIGCELLYQLRRYALNDARAAAVLRHGSG